MLIRIVLAALPLLAMQERVLAADACVACHMDPAFQASNRKLRDYYLMWKSSTHGKAEVACSECHGGDPKLADKAAAHASIPGGTMRAVNFRNIPKTCGSCHGGLYTAFTKSRHFKSLLRKKADAQGPNCVTCHGSLIARNLDPGKLHDACDTCHNKNTDNHPEYADRAGVLVKQLLDARARIKDLGERQRFAAPLRQIALNWHMVDLANVEVETAALLKNIPLK